MEIKKNNLKLKQIKLMMILIREDQLYNLKMMSTCKKTMQISKKYQKEIQTVPINQIIRTITNLIVCKMYNRNPT